jgi:hypothetical protein
MIKDCLDFYHTSLRRLSARRKGGKRHVALGGRRVDARAPFDKGRLVAQRHAPKVPAGDLPDPFNRVRGLDASL